MSINPRVAFGAVALIAAPLVYMYEGEVRESYRDPIGIVTACVGHTGPDVRLGQTYTHAQCMQILREDLASHDAGLVACAGDGLPDNVHAALLSFAFNVGVSKACSSTAIAKAKAGDIPGACAELSRWTRAGGHEMPGLVKRRAAERALCEGRNAPSLGALG